MGNTEKRDLGLYIHIPFCIKKCDYCDFLSTSADDKTKNDYVKAMINEIKSYKDLASEYLVKTIFIGGGTPSSIDSKYVLEILEAVKDVFSIYGIHDKQEDKKGLFHKLFRKEKKQDENEQKENSWEVAEITIEVNPGTITKEKLEVYKAAGINRLSIGLQSADNEELKLLGRIHSFEEFEDNYHLARTLGFHNINIDLMSALPGQNINQWMYTLNKVVELNPEHISAYSLIIEEGTPFYERYQKEDQDDDLDREIYGITKKILEMKGYHRYEISNYAKPGYECKHNSSYWIRTEYLGIGLGASSLLHNARFHNVTDMNEYMELSSDYHKIRRDMDRLVTSQQMEEFMFLGLRMDQGVSKEKFKEIFHKPIEIIYGEVINQSVREGLLKNENGQISLTEKGVDVSNLVMSRFLIDEFIRS
jgi:oxygen-independent coproporphyrinogen-3 oxidase